MGSQTGVSQRHNFLHKRVEIKNFKVQIQQYLMLGTRSNHSKRNSNSGLIRLQKETMKCFSRTQIILWKQMISIHRIQFRILLQLT